MKTTAELLKEYKAMLDDGTISQEEYDKIKADLLSKGNKEYKEPSDTETSKKPLNVANVSNANQQVKGASVSNADKETLSKFGCLIIVIIAIILLFKGCAWLFSGNDDPAASLDYGENYYYDSGTHQVERNLHGILNGAPEP